MSCHQIRDLMFRRLDGELPAFESSLLDSHLAACAECRRQMRILAIPSRIARLMKAPQPSPYFYRRVRARIEGEAQGFTIWQLTLALARYFVPALAAVTLALLSVFTYYQIAGSPMDLYQAYDSILTSPDRPQRMIIADLNEITDESVLQAISEQDPTPRQPVEPEPGKK